jgi:imidazolonepropionase-like amidohydrolase
MRVAVETAHALERLTTAHCRARQSMHNAVDAGLDCIEHAEFLAPTPAGPASYGIEYDARLTDRLLHAGTFVSFTFQAGGYATLLELREDPRADVRERDELERYFEAKQRLFSQLLRDGMLPRMVISTDAGPGDTEFGHLEHGLELAVDSGLSPTRALESVTRIAAEACGVSHLVGTIEAGKLADLLVVEGDPLKRIRAIVDVRGVYVGGCRIQPPQGTLRRPRATP